MELYEVLIRPIITEKSTLLQEEGKYVFQIARRANKVQVKEAVQKSFNVKVEDVNITWLRGRWKRFGPRITRTADMKKAVVTLRAGDKIQLVEGL